ncbi:HEAT repeat domain-containing protein [Clostridium sp. C8-1-8]|uniref:HEAT repeat domain-containing protein n=1 Tax=Clostridium sp. C8-1-8 TaxID=2698831 RepID=UPI00136FAD6F|nr:HEAT repeat domain-containing protein [Clostridium sp. C8-1-8]
MEQYIYYSIILFSIVVEFLYVYIIIEKAMERLNKKRKARYEKQLIPEIDAVVNELIDKSEVTNPNITQVRLKKILRSSLRRDIVEERVVYYLENFKGEFRDILIKFCEDYGIVDYEIKQLNSRNIYKIALICKQLGEIRSKKAIPYLLEQMPSSIQDIKYNALLALAKIGEEESFIKAFTQIDGSILLSERSIIEIIDSFEGEKTKIYSKMIHAEDEFISSLFIKSAGNSLEYSLVEQIASYLDNESKERRIAAIKALGNLKDIRYLEKITSLLNDDSWEVRALAAKTLGRYGESSVIQHLLEKLSDRQWFVRFNSAVAILKLDKELKYVDKVFEGEDKFAKDIIISAMEDLDLISKIVDEGDMEKQYENKLSKLIRDYIENGGETKND